MTAHTMKGDAARCLAAGMDAYVSKPIHPDALFDVIQPYVNAQGLTTSRARDREAGQHVPDDSA
jgi:CheY-like chemotaxis protein